MGDVVFTHAHKVVIDAVGFLVAERARHINRSLVLEALAEALPHALATENPILDRLLIAAVEIKVAAAGLDANRPDAALEWMRASMSASQAFTEFSLWRLGASSARFTAALATDGAVK